MARRRRKSHRRTRRHRNPIFSKPKRRHSRRRYKNPVFQGGVKGLLGNLEVPAGAAVGFILTNFLLSKLGLQAGSWVKTLAPVGLGYIVKNATKGGFLSGISDSMIAVGLVQLWNKYAPETMKVSLAGLGESYSPSSLYYDQASGKIMDLSQPYASVQGLGGSTYQQI